MSRVYLFEFTDQPWYPSVFRRIQTDYLQFVATQGAGHENLIPLLKRALHHTGRMEFVDLCSGASGPWMKLYQQLKQEGLNVKVTLTDKFPNPEALKRWVGLSHGEICYLPEPVDATNVPDHLVGMRTMFEGFHHFRPEQARLILQDAVDKRAVIGIFEASLKPPQGPIIFALSPLMTLLGYLFATPFIRPRIWSRFLWTYLLPIVPLATCWDGLVSFLRVYSPREMRAMVDSLKRNDYYWEIGEAPIGTPLFVFSYLVGYPLGQADMPPNKISQKKNNAE
jgi:hypothetical protein